MTYGRLPMISENVLSTFFTVQEERVHPGILHLGCSAVMGPTRIQYFFFWVEVMMFLTIWTRRK